MSFRTLYQHKHFTTVLFVIIAVGISCQAYFTGSKSFDEVAGTTSTHYNNFQIFQQSFFLLMDHQDMYILHPDLYQDLYKYSPTFALAMAPIALLPTLFGLIVWNLLNLLVLLFALKQLPFFNEKKMWLLLGLLLFEIVTTTQNSQCNALIAGLIILAFTFLENKKMALATLMIVICVYIKLFGFVAFALFLFYPDKIKAALYTLGWMLLFLVLPLIAVPVDVLKMEYLSWWNLLRMDESASLGISVAGIVHSWFGATMDVKMPVLLAGIITFCVPLLNVRRYTEYRFRMLFLASVLIWIIIFNHKAESATFIIAMCGVVIWYFIQNNRNKFELALLILALVLTSLSPTDLFPKFVRDNYVVPYSLKALPCLLIWLKIVAELMFYRKYPEDQVVVTNSP